MKILQLRISKQHKNPCNNLTTQKGLVKNMIKDNKKGRNIHNQENI